jgi:cell division protein FtsZ
VDPEANIIVGAVVDERLEGEIHVTVIATGFEGGGAYRPERNLSRFASGSASAGSVEDQPGAVIPSFLLNRQQNS